MPSIGEFEIIATIGNIYDKITGFAKNSIKSYIKTQSQNETKNETILTHWSVAQAASNDEKNWGSKISLDCPFKDK